MYKRVALFFFFLKFCNINAMDLDVLDLLAAVKFNILKKLMKAFQNCITRHFIIQP